MPYLTNSKEPEPVFFDPMDPEPEPLKKKYQEPKPLGKKIRSRSHLKKKSGAGAAKKFAGSPSLLDMNYEICKQRPN